MTAEPREVVVTGCYGEPVCAFLWDGYCTHPDAEDGQRASLYGPPPDDCPLRERPTLVRLEVRDA